MAILGFALALLGGVFTIGFMLYVVINTRRFFKKIADPDFGPEKFEELKEYINNHYIALKIIGLSLFIAYIGLIISIASIW